MITYVMLAVIFITAPVVLFFILRGVNKMSPDTRGSIRTAYVLKASGVFIVFLAVLDYIFAALGVWNDQPFAWPWLLLIGVGMLFAGMTLLQLVTRRVCHCPECPIRRAMQQIDAEGTS